MRPVQAVKIIDKLTLWFTRMKLNLQDLFMNENLSFNLSRRIFSRQAFDLGIVHDSSLVLQN